MRILYSIALALLVAMSYPAVAEDKGEESKPELPEGAAEPGVDQPAFYEGSPADEAAERTPSHLPAAATVYGRKVPMGESALLPAANYDKSTPPPEKKHWPKERRKMYKHPAKHPAVVVKYSSEPPQKAEPGDEYVYVNVQGRYYHTTKTRVVHSHYLRIPKSQAEEYGYKPSPYTNPGGKERTVDKTPEPQED